MSSCRCEHGGLPRYDERGHRYCARCGAMLTEGDR